MKTTLDLSDAVLERTKAHAARQGTTLRAVVEEALRRYLDGQDTGAARSAFRIQPWGRGGFLPGYEDRTWNEILDEVNQRSTPDDRG